MTTSSVDISFVIPVYNEEESLSELHRELTEVMEKLERSYEILFVNDGSTDGSEARLEELADQDHRIRLIHFRTNFGKSPALAAAFERVEGRIVLTLDADLQDNPLHIPEFVERIEAGADLVSGWKQVRHDPLGKTLPSKLFNFIVRKLSGISLKDFNCGFKAYRIECIRELNVYGGLHRFLPVLAGRKGFRIEQLVVQHRARKFGVSKFGVRRFFHGLLDLLTVLLNARFHAQPLHFFALPGLLFGVLGMLILLYLVVIWFMGEAIGTRPLLLLGILLLLTSGQFIAVGLVCELLVRSTIRGSEIYSIRAERPRGMSSHSPSQTVASHVSNQAVH